MAIGSRTNRRAVRRSRVRKSVRGSNDRPRLSVFKSIKYTYAQVISDESGKVLASASSREIEGLKSKSSVEAAKALGAEIAKRAKEKSIAQVVFDRNGYLYHGRVAAVADGAREGGLTF